MHSLSKVMEGSKFCFSDFSVIWGHISKSAVSEVCQELQIELLIELICQSMQIFA